MNPTNLKGHVAMGLRVYPLEALAQHTYHAVNGQTINLSAPLWCIR
jgi:hypothetical protein